MVVNWGGGGGVWPGVSSLLFSVPRSPTSCTFVPLYLPILVLHCILSIHIIVFTSVFRLLEKIDLETVKGTNISG